MSVLRAMLIRALDQVFGEHVHGYTVTEMRDEPLPALTMAFTVYDYFPVEFEYDRGRFGFRIAYARPVRVRIAPHTSADLADQAKVVQTVEALREAIRLRIPPAYLASIGA